MKLGRCLSLVLLLLHERHILCGQNAIMAPSLKVTLQQELATGHLSRVIVSLENWWSDHRPSLGRIPDGIDAGDNCLVFFLLPLASSMSVHGKETRWDHMSTMLMWPSQACT